MKTKSYIMVFEMIILDGNVIAGQGRVDGFWKTLRLAPRICAIPHKLENPQTSVRKFLQQHHH